MQTQIFTDCIYANTNFQSVYIYANTIFTDCIYIYIYANTKVIPFIIDLVNDMQILSTHPTDLSTKSFFLNQSTVCLKNKKKKIKD